MIAAALRTLRSWKRVTASCGEAGRVVIAGEKAFLHSTLAQEFRRKSICSCFRIILGCTSARKGKEEAVGTTAAAWTKRETDVDEPGTESKGMHRSSESQAMHLSYVLPPYFDGSKKVRRSCTSSLLPRKQGTRWWMSVGWTSSRRSVPVVAIPPACSVKKATTHEEKRARQDGRAEGATGQRNSLGKPSYKRRSLPFLLFLSLG
jgi:hypothetical protein